MAVLAVAIGGAAGSVLRYLIARAIDHRAPAATADFPLGIFAVNVAGALLLGLIATALLERASVSEPIRLALTVGLLGGFTTFSTLSFDSLALIDAGRWHIALLNLAASAAAGLAAVWLGQQLARL